MVNRGGPSKACQECRRRKIRCDQQRPQCSQCTRVGRQCPGYRNLDDVIFRPYPGQAKGDDDTRSRTSQISAKGSIDSEEEQISLPIPTTGTTSANRRHAISRPPAANPQLALHPSSQLGIPSWDQQAVGFFLAQYTFIPNHPQSSSGWFEFVPDLYRVSSSTSCFQPAVLAIAYASLAGQSSLTWLATEARKIYGMAITRVNAAIANPSSAVEDDVLASVLMLGLYENLIGDHTVIMGSHREGLRMLLHLRGPQQLDSRRGRSLYRHIRSLFRVHEFNNGTDSKALDEVWIVSVAQEESLSSIAHLSNNVGTWCARVNEFITLHDHDPLLVAGLEDLVFEGEALDAELIEWAASSGPGWTGHRFAALPGLKQGAQPEYILTYDDPFRMSSTNLYRTCRIYIHETLYLIYQTQTQVEVDLEMSDMPFAPASLSSRTEDSVNIIQSLISQVCATVPFAMDDVDSHCNLNTGRPRVAIKAFISMWGLWISKSSPLATEEQVRYATAGLQRISDFWGFKLAGYILQFRRDLRFGHIDDTTS